MEKENQMLKKDGDSAFPLTCPLLTSSYSLGDFQVFALCAISSAWKRIAPGRPSEIHRVSTVVLGFVICNFE